ncbi:hypothetical protein OIU77_007906 [Salix suchowensis]|uniref:Uncharacterized protein n=1 Tax=Salix suchowensis TaxID=1278906 RepID=A0ABQ9AHU2_9ROSI|nr:hypothetical protein OIU77_007906 [Salix suchowensis]
MEVACQKLCNSLEQHAVKVPPPVSLRHLFFNKVPQLEKEVTVAEYCMQNHSSRSVTQKWIPIGVKDPELTTSARFGNSLPDPSDGPAGEDLTLRNVHDKANFDSQDLVSSLMLGTCQDSGNEVCFPQEDNHIHKLKNSTLWMDELNKKHGAADALTNELSCQQFSAFEDESIKIIQSVKDVCRVQMESEAIQMATVSHAARHVWMTGLLEHHYVDMRYQISHWDASGSGMKNMGIMVWK